MVCNSSLDDSGRVLANTKLAASTNVVNAPKTNIEMKGVDLEYSDQILVSF